MSVNLVSVLPTKCARLDHRLHHSSIIIGQCIVADGQRSDAESRYLANNELSALLAYPYPSWILLDNSEE
jgi:hypothetical protein